jgi:hypothetical protein
MQNTAVTTQNTCWARMKAVDAPAVPHSTFQLNFKDRLFYNSCLQFVVHLTTLFTDSHYIVPNKRVISA